MRPPKRRTGHARLLWDPTAASSPAVLAAVATAQSSLASTNVCPLARTAFVFVFRGITLSRIVTCSEQSPFLGLREEKG